MERERENFQRLHAHAPLASTISTASSTLQSSPNASVHGVANSQYHQQQLLPQPTLHSEEDAPAPALTHEQLVYHELKLLDAKLAARQSLTRPLLSSPQQAQQPTSSLSSTDESDSMHSHSGSHSGSSGHSYIDSHQTNHELIPPPNLQSSRRFSSPSTFQQETVKLKQACKFIACHLIS